MKTVRQVSWRKNITTKEELASFIMEVLEKIPYEETPDVFVVLENCKDVLRVNGSIEPGFVEQEVHRTLLRERMVKKMYHQSNHECSVCGCSLDIDDDALTMSDERTCEACTLTTKYNEVRQEYVSHIEGFHWTLRRDQLLLMDVVHDLSDHQQVVIKCYHQLLNGEKEKREEYLETLDELSKHELIGFTYIAE